MSLERPEWKSDDIQLYNKLFYQSSWDELTEEEKKFCRAMYVMEEHAVGLDG